MEWLELPVHEFRKRVHGVRLRSGAPVIRLRRKSAAAWCLLRKGSFRGPSSHKRRADAVWLAGSRQSSLLTPPLRGHRLDLAIIHDLAGVRFSNPALNLFQMPLLDLSLRLHCLP